MALPHGFFNLEYGLLLSCIKILTLDSFPGHFGVTFATELPRGVWAMILSHYDQQEINCY
jgi:hypothetical protein